MTGQNTPYQGLMPNDGRAHGFITYDTALTILPLRTIARLLEKDRPEWRLLQATGEPDGSFVRAYATFIEIPQFVYPLDFAVSGHSPPPTKNWVSDSYQLHDTNKWKLVVGYDTSIIIACYIDKKDSQPAPVRALFEAVRQRFEKENLMTTTKPDERDYTRAVAAIHLYLNPKGPDLTDFLRAVG